MTIFGNLYDKNIILLYKEGKLIISNFNEDNMKQACYELTVGNIYHDIFNGQKTIY
ncbi:hypothetical protein [Staphylococcus felis]|uniref:hypothetical protein n=1 Tax=Staphylococcus felis TaxID=46127 RepID=UPI00248040D8|nr:hypothetical protein [Staphylococcus felis]